MPKNEYKYFQKSFNLKHRVSQIYRAPKLHKNKKNNQIQFRPVLSKCGSLAEVASKWIDVQLQEIPIRSKLKDTFELLENLQTIKLEPNTEYLWISADAISMHSNMEINNTIKTVCSYITKITGIDKIRFNLELLIELLEIVLTTNLFMFGDLHFQQTNSIAMGTSCAVTIANIYVAYQRN